MIIFLYENHLYCNHFYSLKIYHNGLSFLYKNMIITLYLTKNKLLKLTKKIFVDFTGLFFIVNAHEFDV